MGEVARYLKKWEVDVPGVHRRLILVPTLGSGVGGTPFGSWLKAGGTETRQFSTASSHPVGC